MKRARDKGGSVVRRLCRSSRAGVFCHLRPGHRGKHEGNDLGMKLHWVRRTDDSRATE